LESFRADERRFKIHPMLFFKGSILARETREIATNITFRSLQVNDNGVEAQEVIYLKRRLLMAFVQHLLYMIVHGAAPRETEAEISAVFSASGPAHVDW
jgi:hypothetical protein